MDKVQRIREEVERLKSQLLRGACSSQIAMETMCKEEAYNEVLAILDTMQEEPVSEDLGDYINELSKQFPEVSFAKLSRIAVRVAKWQKEKMMAKAVDGEVTYGKSLAIPSLGWVLDKEELNFGDKVKLIIIKQE